MRLIIHLTVLCLGLLLAGCGSVIDADQARICRDVAPALHDEGAIIEEVSLVPVPGADALRLAYRVRLGARALPHWIVCRFAGQTGAARATLTGVDTDAGPLSDVKFYMIKRWWLAEPPARALPPAWLALSARQAYWLQQAMNGTTLAGIYGLVATGFALVHGLFGRINLAFGEIAVAGGVYMLIAIGTAGMAGRLGPGDLTLALAVGIIASMSISWLVGRYVVLPLTAASRSPQTVLIGTIAVAIVLAEAARITAPSRLNWLPPLLNVPFPLAGEGEGFVATVTAAQMLAAGLSLVGASILLGMMAFTRFGRAWRAYADDPLMATLLGVRAPALRSGTFLIAGAAAGLAGTVSVIAYGTVQPGEGLTITLKALISAIIGGIGSVPGAFLGAVIVAGVEIVWSAAFDIVYRDLVIYALLAAFLVLRPGGLLNNAAPRPREF
ncbi:branched-chain amino acid ABC transporter permease [Ancylobacter oerskovii]|uniref:Branched-chain amino acid ABC transporter permease n=1 Tax=Ancylobacter oerskovii TaxID=459519 RepID=A0ABW4Z3J2_9HYPH|nr:branched-chain amino acid ABC transporter permease [Ancylobacter oerskovii]MBS7546168.1 branched-chain amino acid ABC transporter permease [Ancylobacter oerskovii]